MALALLYQLRALILLHTTQIARVQAQRAHLTSEYTSISKAARRALHELEMASWDLRAAEDRRKLADSHVEKARLGVLGIDHLPTAST